MPHRDRRQLRRDRSTAIRRCSTSCVSRNSRTSWPGRLQADHPRAEAAAAPKGLIPLTVVGDRGKPLNGACMTSAGGGDEHLRQLQHAGRPDVVSARGDEEARVPDHRRRAHGPVRNPQAARPHDRPRRGALRLPRLRRRRRTVNRTHRRPAGRGARETAATRFEALAAWKNCDDCAFIPVCAGGCTVAAHTELGDMNRPNCHKSRFEAGVVSLARDAATRELATIN